MSRKHRRLNSWQPSVDPYYTDQYNNVDFRENNQTWVLWDMLESATFPILTDQQENGYGYYKPFEEIYKNGKKWLMDFSGFGMELPWYTSDGDGHGGKVGMDDFFNQFILTYRKNQINADTTADFKLDLMKVFVESMDELAQLYDTTKIEYDPLVNQIIKDQRVRDEVGDEKAIGSKQQNIDNAGNSETDNTSSNNRNIGVTGKRSDVENTGTSTDDSLHVENDTQTQSIHSDNPQVNFQGIDYASSMDRGQQLEDGDNQRHIDVDGNRDLTSDTEDDTIDTSEGESTSQGSTQSHSEDATNTSSDTESTSHNEEEYTREGFVGGSQADYLLKYRETIVDINGILIERCRKLFKMYRGGFSFY